MTKYLITLAVLLSNATSYAQKKTFDIISYQAPAGWAAKEGNGYISYSKVDGSSWAQIAIYQHRSSEGDVQKDFDKDWKELVAPASRGISAPEKTVPQTANGWTVMSGAGVWQFNGANVASILTTYSNNTVCVSLLCNATAEPYLKEYQTLIGSLNLDAGATAPAQTTATPPSNTNTNPSVNTNEPSIAGLWCDYLLETRGYINGMPQYTAGYFRKEYSFNTDGTYIYRVKNWSTMAKDILFVYETGTYLISGNQLTITPRKGKGEWWGKQGGKTNEWGSLVKSADYKTEKVTYTFEIKYFSGSKSYSLILRPGQSTVREGDISHQPDFHYAQRTLQTLIDNPPGFNVKM